MPHGTQIKDVGQAAIAGGVPVTAYLNDLSLWVTIIAGVASILWATVSLFKVLFPQRFSAFVAKIDRKK